MFARDTARWLEWVGTLEHALLETPPDNLVCVTDMTQAVCWQDAPRDEWLYDAHRFISGMRPSDMLRHMTAYAPARLLITSQDVVVFRRKRVRLIRGSDFSGEAEYNV